MSEPSVTPWRSAVDVALREGIETPAYIYDLAEVRANAVRLRAAVPEGAAIYYSLKANPHPALLAELRVFGMRPEVCSPGELDSALAAGWSANDVLYTGPGKRDCDIARALRQGVRDFCADSPTGLDQLARLASQIDTEVRCLLRINDDVPGRGRGLAMTGVASQFGADTQWVLAEPAAFASRSRARVVGLHLYAGTNLTKVDDLLDQFARSVDTACQVTAALSGHGVQVEILDLGGGFGAPFAADGPTVPLTGTREGLNSLLEARLADWPGGRPRVLFESGRYLVGAAGTLVTGVLDAKRSHGVDVVVLESGINHLGGMSGMRRLPPLRPHLAVHAPARGAPVPTMVTGPLCTPLDSWSRDTPLPPLRPGDLLAVPNVGAYGLSASLLAFLGHPAPVEVVVDGDAVVDVSRLRLIRKE